MVTKPFKIGPFGMSLSLSFFFVFVLMELVPGAKDQDSAGSWPIHEKKPTTKNIEIMVFHVFHGFGGVGTNIFRKKVNLEVLYGGVSARSDQI